jgi:hypothetical protein
MMLNFFIDILWLNSTLTLLCICKTGLYYLPFTYNPFWANGSRIICPIHLCIDASHTPFQPYLSKWQKTPLNKSLPGHRDTCLQPQLLGKLRQEVHYFEASLGYIATPCLQNTTKKVCTHTILLTFHSLESF